MDQEDRSQHSLPADGPASPADRRLLEQLRSGDPEASYRFIQECYPRVYRYLLHLTGSSEAAEDLTQETFLQAWRHLDTFEGRAALRTWLHRIAHREYLQALRSQRRAAAEPALVPLEAAEEVCEPRATRLSEAVALRAIIDHLPLEEREIVVLHYLEGYSYEEVAEILGIPVHRVRYRLSGARARLQQALGEGDLPYLNEPSVPMRQWAWLPLDQMYALATRLTPHARSQASKEDDMERREFLRQAAVGAAGLMLTETEKEVVDSRLTQKVSCAFKATALSDLCEKLKADTGIHLAGGPSVADEKVTLFCEKLPLREVMRQLSRPFGYTWLRSKREGGEYRYELVQDLKSQLLEEELRNRDRNTALLALEQELEKYRPYLDLSPDEALARAKTAPPEEKKLLESLSSGLGYGPIQMYFRLSPQEMAAIRAGQWIAFDAVPRPDDPLPPRLPGAVVRPGARPLPPDIAVGILQSWRQERIRRGPRGLSVVGAEEPDAVPIASVPELRPWLNLTLEQTEPGQYSLLGHPGFRGPGFGARGNVWRMGGGRSPKVLQPDNETVNARFAGDLDLRPRLSVEPQPSCRSAPTPGATSDSLPEPKVTAADVLETVHRATGLPLVADAYTRLYKPETVTVRDQPRFAALNRLADTMRLRWNKEDRWLQFRSTSFYDDRLKEVPNRLLARWAAARRQHGLLTLDDLVEIARLPDTQLQGEEMAEGARVCSGLAEWDLARHQNVLPNLRFLGQFTPGQRQEAMTTAGLPFTKMTVAQQQGFLDRAVGSRAGGLEEGESLQSLADLEGATLRVDYTQPGWYEWQPPSPDWLRWFGLLGPPPGGRLLLTPVVRERTREATLQALRRLDPQIREAVRETARRADPGNAAILPTEEAQIVPTKLELTTLYIPGTANKFPVQFQSTSRLQARRAR